MELGLNGSTREIDSSNVGFKLLKKCGWKEGTGLGVSEQGRLEPVEAHVKNNKIGLGAEKIKKKAKHLTEGSSDDLRNERAFLQPKKKAKTAFKRIKKMLEDEERMKEREFQRAFFREFWPDNV